LHTREQWGAEQRDAYLEAINRALATLSANPRIGRERDEIVPGLRSYGVQQHIIFYRLDADIATVLRILHRKMDTAPLLVE
jgi:toxin ParE1/3/4